MSNTTTPKGWKWVPVEPTPEMVSGGAGWVDTISAWAAMLAAAPDAPAPTASAEQVTPEMLRAGRLTKAGRFVCSGVPGGHGYLTELYLAMRSAAPPAPAVEQNKPTPTLWRVRPLTGGDWTYYDFPPKYALADSTKEVQAFAEVAVSGAPKEGGAA